MKKHKQKSSFEKECRDCGVMVRFEYNGKIRRFLPPIELATGNRHFCKKWEEKQISVKAELHDLATGAKAGAIAEKLGVDVDSIARQQAQTNLEVKRLGEEVASLTAIVNDFRRKVDALNSAVANVEHDFRVATMDAEDVQIGGTPN